MMNANEIDWSKAPEWATLLLQNNSESGYYAWAESFKLDAKARLVKSTDDSFFRLMPSCWVIEQERPAAWDGEDLPPLNTNCLYTMQTNHPTPNWYECTVTYVVGDGSGVVANCKACGIEVEQFLSESITLFKPLPVKSKADIDKEKAIAAILEDVTSIWASSDVELAQALYKLGYKKGE